VCFISLTMVKGRGVFYYYFFNLVKGRHVFYFLTMVKWRVCFISKYSSTFLHYVLLLLCLCLVFSYCFTFTSVSWFSLFLYMLHFPFIPFICRLISYTLKTLLLLFIDTVYIHMAVWLIYAVVVVVGVFLTSDLA